MPNHTGYITDHTTTKLGVQSAWTWVDFQDGEVARSVATGIIKSVGIIPAGTAGTGGAHELRYAKGDASGIAGYRKLTSVGGRGTLGTRSAVAGTGVRALIEEYATEAGDMDGVVINSMTDFDWQVQAKRSVGTEDVVIEVRVYVRNAVGEILYATDETDCLTVDWALYAGTMPSFSYSFQINERLVMKYYTYNKGEPV